MCVCESFSHVWLFATLWTVARQAPLSMGFSRQEYWSGLPCPPGDLPNPGTEPTSLTSPSLAGGFFITSTHLGSLYMYIYIYIYISPLLEISFLFRFPCSLGHSLNVAVWKNSLTLVPPPCYVCNFVLFKWYFCCLLLLLSRFSPYPMCRRIHQWVKEMKAPALTELHFIGFPSWRFSELVYKIIDCESLFILPLPTTVSSLTAGIKSTGL